MTERGWASACLEGFRFQSTSVCWQLTGTRPENKGPGPEARLQGHPRAAPLWALRSPLETSPLFRWEVDVLEDRGLSSGARAGARQRARGLLGATGPAGGA